MSATRFDVIYSSCGCTIQPHYCREWDDEDGGCYGTNSDHGYSFDEACDQVAEWHDRQAALWRSRQSFECLHYTENDNA